MSGEKLSSDEVPQKFIEWLLDMGCPAEKIPSIEKMIGMCRGQYYMSWRSLMEHVQAKDVISHKRLTVFYDDVKICQQKKLLNEQTSSPFLPEQLSLWKEHTKLKQLVSDAEARVNNARAVHKELMDKARSKVIQRNSTRQRIADLQRRSWLISQVVCDLNTKLANVKETRAIADSLCNIEKQHDKQNKLDECLALLQRKRKLSYLPLSTPVASSSIASNHENETSRNEKDDFVLSLVNCRADVLWPQMLEKLSTLYSRLAEAYTKHVKVVNNRSNAESILAHTIALQSTLGFETIKNKADFRTVRQQLAAFVEELSNYITEDEFELFEVKVQKAYHEARVKSLEASLDKLTSRAGVFEWEDDHSGAVDDAQATLRNIASVNKCILKSREELTRLIVSSAKTEQKIFNIRECLLAIFTAFHSNTDIRKYVLSRGVEIDFPTESMSVLRQFYKKWSKESPKNNISFDLDISDSLPGDIPDNPTFEDELNVYLKKFNLEKNRTIVLDNGEKVWTFETIRELSSRLQTRWVHDDVTVLLCPAVWVSRALQKIYDETHVSLLEHNFLDDISSSTAPDIAAITDHEADTVDKMKKRITENLNLLQKIHKNLDTCRENLQFWSEHQLKNYISDSRTIDNKTYKEYEASYIERLNW